MEKNQTLIKLVEREIRNLKQVISETNQTIFEVNDRLNMLLDYRNTSAAQLDELQKFLETLK